MGSSSPNFGGEHKKIFELPPPSFFLQRFPLTCPGWSFPTTPRVLFLSIDDALLLARNFWIKSPCGLICHWNRKKALPHDNDKLQMTNFFLGTAFFTSHYFNHDPCQSSCFQFLSFVCFLGSAFLFDIL